MGREIKDPDNPWNQFTRVDKDFPGESEVGSVHYAPNSTGDYDWDNTNEVWTYADDWLTYPEPAAQEEAAERGDRRLGTGSSDHHAGGWTHLPHNPGVTDGFYNNWWQYIVNYDEAMKKLPPPGATFLKAKTAMYAE